MLTVEGCSETALLESGLTKILSVCNFGNTFATIHVDCPFTMLTVEGSSEMALFRYWSNQVFDSL